MDKHRIVSNIVKSKLIQYASKNIKNKNLILLDLCCGRGGDIFKWNKFRIKRVIGIDNHEPSIIEAVNRYKKVSRTLKTKISFILGDVSKLSFKDTSIKYNIISCNFAIHYFDLESFICRTVFSRSFLNEEAPSFEPGL